MSKSCTHSSLESCEDETAYPWKFDAAITTLGRSTGLLDVKVSKSTAWSLYNADLVRSGVVSALELAKFPECSESSSPYGFRRL